MTCDRDEFYILRIPDTGSLHLAVHIIAHAGLTITRCQYNRSIDPVTAFFSVKGDEGSCRQAADILKDKGYLQTTIRYPKVMRFTVIVPEIPGTLDRILSILDRYHSEITTLSFDNRGKSPDHLQIAVRVRDPAQTGELLEAIRTYYRVEVLGFDCGEDDVDENLFYLRYAEKVRNIIGDSEDPYLLDLLNQFSHIAQQLTEHGKEYQEVLDQILQNGLRLLETTGQGYYADVQKISLPCSSMLYCFQLPGGGSIFVLETPDEMVMIDTGYGIYHEDVMRMFDHYGLLDQDFSRIILTHGDTDHCGAAGFFDVPVYTHQGTWKIIETNNRAWGATSQDLVLEQVYTVMINLFSRMHPPKNVEIFPPEEEKPGEFPVIGSFTLGGLKYEILQGHGGHQHGMIYVLSRDAGVFFTSDTILNLKHLSPERSEYNLFAVYLVTTVNVDPELVKTERKALLKLAIGIDNDLKKEGRRLLICCGHGPVSVIEEGDLIPVIPPEIYRHR